MRQVLKCFGRDQTYEARFPHFDSLDEARRHLTDEEITQLLNYRATWNAGCEANQAKNPVTVSLDAMLGRLRYDARHSWGSLPEVTRG